VDIAAVDKAMVPCLQAKLPYKLASTVSPAYLEQAIASAPAAARSAPFQQLPNDVQIILEASALALQVQAQHDMLYRRSQYPAADSLGYMTGWLVRCLADAGVQPAFTQSPFPDYNQFMQIPNSLQNHQAALFNQGFYYNSMGIEPLPLMPLPVSQPGTPLPALPPVAPLGGALGVDAIKLRLVQFIVGVRSLALESRIWRVRWRRGWCMRCARMIARTRAACW
jgi:hypothetical protein